MNFDDVLALAGTQLWQVTGLIAVVALVARRVARRRPHLAHVLWLVVLVKCVTPPLVSSPVGVFSRLQPVRRETASESGTLRVAALPESSIDERVATIAQGELREAIEASSTEIAPPAVDGKSIGSSPARVLPSPLTGEGLGMGGPNVARRDFRTGDARDGTTRHILGSAEPRAADGRDDVFERGSALTSSSDTSLATLPKAALLLWLAGATILLITALWRGRACLREVRAAARIERPDLENLVGELCRQLKIARRVRLIVTASRVGPAVVGLFRPTILLPVAVVAGKNADALRPILAHELLHVRRGDLCVGALQVAAQSLWWFHPLVWLANRLATRAAEACCDEETIAELGCRADEYAQNLLDVLELKRRLIAVPAFPGLRPVDVTRERMERIMQLGQGCRRRTPWWCWIVLLMAALAVLPGGALVVSGEAEGKAAPKAVEAAGAANAPPAKQHRFDVQVGTAKSKGDGTPSSRASIILLDRADAARESVGERIFTAEADTRSVPLKPEIRDRLQYNLVGNVVLRAFEFRATCDRANWILPREKTADLPEVAEFTLSMEGNVRIESEPEGEKLLGQMVDLSADRVEITFRADSEKRPVALWETLHCKGNVTFRQSTSVIRAAQARISRSARDWIRVPGDEHAFFPGRFQMEGDAQWNWKSGTGSEETKAERIEWENGKLPGGLSDAFGEVLGAAFQAEQVKPKVVVEDETGHRESGADREQLSSHGERVKVIDEKLERLAAELNRRLQHGDLETANALLTFARKMAPRDARVENMESRLKTAEKLGVSREVAELANAFNEFLSERRLDEAEAVLVKTREISPVNNPVLQVMTVKYRMACAAEDRPVPPALNGPAHKERSDVEQEDVSESGDPNTADTNIRRLVDQFNDLITQNRLDEAEAVVKKAGEIAPTALVLEVLRVKSKLARQEAENKAVSKPNRNSATSGDLSKHNIESDFASWNDITQEWVEVRVEGNEAIASDEILKKVTARAGGTPNATLVKEDVASLFRTRWFTTVEPRVERNEIGAVLVFKVIERPILKSVEFKGKKKIKSKDLAELTGLRTWGDFDARANKELAQRIESYYREKGFRGAEVKLEKGGDPGDREVVIVIDEGKNFEPSLGQHISLHFENAPLQDVIRHMARFLMVNIHLDRLGLADAGVTPKTPVSIEVDGITLKSALKLVLEPLQLCFVVRNEVLLVTSSTRANGEGDTPDSNILRLVDQFNDLMTQNRLDEAEAVVEKAREVAPTDPVVEVIRVKSNLARQEPAHRSAKESSHREPEGKKSGAEGESASRSPGSKDADRTSPRESIGIGVKSDSTLTGVIMLDETEPRQDAKATDAKGAKEEATAGEIALQRARSERLERDLAHFERHLRRKEFHAADVMLEYARRDSPNEPRLDEMQARVKAARQQAADASAAKPIADNAEMRPPNWHTDFSDACDTAAAEKRPLLAYFRTQWCGPCTNLERELLDRPEVTAQLSAKFVLARICLDCDANRPLMSKFQVNAMPTILVISPDGAELLRMSGYVSKSHEKLLASLLNVPTEVANAKDASADKALRDARKLTAATRRRLSTARAPDPKTPAELKIDAALDENVSLHFENAPLSEVIQHLAAQRRINIVIDRSGLEDAGMRPSTPVSIAVDDIKLESALKLLLDPFHVTHIFRDEVLLITSRIKARGDLQTITYPVADLIASKWSDRVYLVIQHGDTVEHSVALTYAANKALSSIMARTKGWKSVDKKIWIVRRLRESGPFGQIVEADPTYGMTEATIPYVPLQQGDTVFVQTDKPQSLKIDLPTALEPADFEELIKLITSTVEPDSWIETGGQGAIQPYKTTQSLVVRQTQDVHDRIGNLLKYLRQPQTPE